MPRTIVVIMSLFRVGLIPLGFVLVGSLPAQLKVFEEGCSEYELLALREWSFG